MTGSSVRHCIAARAELISGCFANKQLAMIDAIARTWRAAGHPMRIIAIAVNRIEGLPLGADHAGISETTLLGGLWPDRVRGDRLPSIQTAPLAPGDVWEEGRHNPSHPLWGVVGPDPRGYEASQGPLLVAACANGLVYQVHLEIGGS